MTWTWGELQASSEEQRNKLNEVHAFITGQIRLLAMSQASAVPVPVVPGAANKPNDGATAPAPGRNPHHDQVCRPVEPTKGFVQAVLAEKVARLIRSTQARRRMNVVADAALWAKVQQTAPQAISRSVKVLSLRRQGSIYNNEACPSAGRKNEPNFGAQSIYINLIEACAMGGESRTKVLCSRCSSMSPTRLSCSS
jgi:hypothetical protein